MPQGMLRMDVPIIVFHMAKLRRESEQRNRQNRQVDPKPKEDMTKRGQRSTHMVMMLGFLEVWSLPVTLKAVPRGL